MRALFKTLLAAFCITMIWNVGDVLIGSRKFLDQPRIHVVKDGEYFSQLAQDYYGNPDYWRALALINRAPRVDRIYPGEHVILPDAGTIAAIARSQRMTEVNELVANQQAMAVLESDHDADEFDRDMETAPAIEEASSEETESAAEPLEQAQIAATQTETPEVQTEDGAADGREAIDALSKLQTSESSDQTSSMMWPIAGFAAVLFAAIAFAYRRRRKSQEEEPEIDASPIKSFILDNDDEKTAIYNESTAMDNTTSVSDDIFKPVRRRNEAEREKEVDLTIQDG